jgi:diguanylate cyclase (GGDEF)-like protein/PAS domain S-box-containing protein/hemerythrin-like metal-binding protein
MNEFTETDDALFFSAFTYAAIGMAIVAPDGTWLKVNNALCAMMGYAPQQLMGMTFQDITHPDDLGEDLRFVNQLLAGEIDSYQMEKRYLHREGRVIHGLLSVSLVKTPQRTPRFFISQIQDITRKKEMESELARMAREDELTGVFNRRYFMEMATREVIRGRRFREPQAIMMIDIDHFKKINDTYGHEVGDQVLHEMARGCSASLRGVDVFGRLGGEEFGALLLNTDSEIAGMLAERMRRGMESLAVETPAGTVRFTVSIGMATFTEPDLSLDALLKKADDALYEAKKTGRNRVVAERATPGAKQPARDGMRTSFVRLEWKKEYESGCPLVDRQHQNLFLLANDLLSAIVSGLPDDHVDTQAKGLVAEVEAHFRDESAAYRAAGYPGADAHNRIHHALVQDMRATLERFKGGRASVAELFELVAVRIIREHLLSEDRKFFPYIQAAQSC